jgi:4a-hydroxytetrahydrobiopterin dehydratase
LTIVHRDDACRSRRAITTLSQGGLRPGQFLLLGYQGWRDFLAAENVDDWVVLHGGATAVFPVLSLADAVRLADAVAQVLGIEGASVLITIADDQLTVRLTRGIWQLKPEHVELARAVSAVARRHGAVADRARAQEVQLAIAGRPETVDVGFWRAALGYAELADDNAVDPLGHGSTVWVPEAWTLADRAGNRVCICAWPDGATGSDPPTPESR